MRTSGTAKILATILLILGLVSFACKSRSVESTPQTTWALRRTSTPFSTRSSSTVFPPTYTPLPTVVEPGLAYGEPCKPPCWWGLIPGQSTRQEAAEIVEEVRASEWANQIVEGPGGYSFYPFTSGYPAYSISLSFNDSEILQEIRGSVGFSHSVGSLIEQFGEPEGIFSANKIYGTYKDTCSSCDGWKSPTQLTPESSTVALLYPGQGLWFWIRIPSNGFGCICSEMQVDRFLYYQPCSMQTILRYHNDLERALHTEPIIEITENDLIEWHSFGGGYN